MMTQKIALWKFEMEDIKMINEKDIPDEPDVLREQINVRMDLKSRMVGQLYPSILHDKIERLWKRIAKIRK